jgi:lipopolysaccharide transport system permease protein
VTSSDAVHYSVTTITPDRHSLPLIKEAWVFRDLFYSLVRRNITTRYNQTILGVGWSVLQPLLTMVVFSIFFGRVAKLPSSGIPYPVFSLAAVVPWTYFANTVLLGATSLVGNSQLLTKIYFPRIFIPGAAIGSGLIDLAIAMVILLIVMASFGFVPVTASVLLLPICLLLLVLTTAGVTFWLSALGVQYRDVRFVTPFLMQLWLFATPIIYPLSLIPSDLRLLYSLNPMVGIIDGFRVALLETGPIEWASLGLALVVGTIILASGVWYYRRIESVFADIA